MTASKSHSSHPWRTAKNVSLGLLAWVIALAFFFPIAWMIFSAFKTENQAFEVPPVLVFQPILENFVRAFAKYGPALKNSLVVAFGSSLLSFALGLPAAFSMAFYPNKRSRSTLMWVVSTKMMPPVGVIVPLYLIFKDLHLLDTLLGLTLMYTTMNLPLVVWMMHSYLSEIPIEILEAARLERSLLRTQPDQHRCRAALGLHQRLQNLRGIVLGGPVCRRNVGDLAGDGVRMVGATSTRAGFDDGRGQINVRKKSPSRFALEFAKEFRRERSKEPEGSNHHRHWRWARHRFRDRQSPACVRRSPRHCRSRPEQRCTGRARTRG
jgi:hypothetical protein